MIPQTDLGFTFKIDQSAGLAPNSSPHGGNVPPAVPAVSGTEAALISQEWQTPPVADDAPVPTRKRRGKQADVGTTDVTNTDDTDPDSIPVEDVPVVEEDPEVPVETPVAE